VDNQLDAVSMLYVFPVALIGISHGRWAGLVAGCITVGLIAAWVLLRSPDLSAIGWLARALPMLLMGVLIGDASDRLDLAAEEREAYRLALDRQQEAVEINDTLVQRMSAAKWSIEAGRIAAGLQILGQTVELGHKLVSELIRQTDADMSETSGRGTKLHANEDARP
jgi:hypothetical protein